MSGIAATSSFSVIPVRPDGPEITDQAAQGMANSGFTDLRSGGLDRFELANSHPRQIGHRAGRFYASLEAAVANRDLVLGSTTRVRHDLLPVNLPDMLTCVKPSVGREDNPKKFQIF